MESNVLKILIYMLISTGLSFVLTPQIIKFAVKIGAVDIPKDDRRIHTKPIPRLGGLSIYMVFISMFLFVNHMDILKNFGIITASFIIILMGVKDDITPMKAKEKFLIQILAAIILYSTGFKIEFLTNFFSDLTLNFVGIYIGDYIYFGSIFSFIVTVFWIVGITNTINLIDGLDGLAAGVSFIASIAIATVAFLNGRIEVAMLTLILSGAILGFLPYNFNPARVFMGDTGSLFLGLMLSVLSIEGAVKTTTAFTLFIPVIILGIPIFDTAFAIVRRFLSGKSISEADKGHLHHRLLFLGMNQKRAVLSLYFISSLFAFSAVFAVKDEMIYSVISLVIACIFIFIPINKTKSMNNAEAEDA